MFQPAPIYLHRQRVAGARIIERCSGNETLENHDTGHRRGGSEVDGTRNYENIVHFDVCNREKATGQHGN